MSSKKGASDTEEMFDIEFNSEMLDELKGRVVLIKYGGNAMRDEEIKQKVIADIVALKDFDIVPVVVHGGGPAIKQLLGDVGIESEFIGGHRKTTEKAMRYVEMALSGQVNSDLVKGLNKAGCKAVGLSGKDASMVIAQQRTHTVQVDGETEKVSLGHVGNVKRINTDLVRSVIKEGYIPVIAPIGVGEDMKDYNINADMFAGHMAGALEAARFVALTDVDGLLEDPENPQSLIPEMSIDKAESEIGKSVQGGMIPKVEACLIALKEGVEEAHIVNGMKPHTILKQLLTQKPTGTRFVA